MFSSLTKFFNIGKVSSTMNNGHFRIILNGKLEEKESPATIKYQDLNSKKDVALLYTSAHDELVSEERVTDNHFVNTFLTSYNHHKDLILSPDDLLIAINMVISNYVNNNAEALRHVFVDHEGKKNLCVEYHKLDWDVFISLINDEINKNVKSDLQKFMVANFSTTTPVIATTAMVTIMDTFKQYFGYSMMLCCGIPAVQLTGSHEDWANLQSKYEHIKQILPGLSWWYKYFDVIMDMFMKMRQLQKVPICSEAMATEDMKDLWSRVICKIPYGSGGQHRIGGWLNLFFPYGGKYPCLNEGDQYNPLDLKVKLISKNDFKDSKGKVDRYQWQDHLQEWFKISRSEDGMPKSVSNCPVKFINKITNEEKNLQLCAGFVGTQIENDCVKPLIGYDIYEQS